MSVKPFENFSLKTVSSMKTGGIAPKAYFPENEEELTILLTILPDGGERVKIFGNAGNVLFPDENITFTPIFTGKMKNITETPTEQGLLVYAESGVSFTSLAYAMCQRGYAGMTFAYGIPASVGGAVYMNAGAYGGETANVVSHVRCFDRYTRQIVLLSRDECDFSYRHSVFHDGRYAIIGAYFYLKAGESEALLAEAKDFMNRRKEKQPLEYPSCGSAFKRPAGHFAGQLIEEAGLKGYTVGGAQISQKHAGFIVNVGNATTADVLQLIADVKERVLKNSGVELFPEIQIEK